MRPIIASLFASLSPAARRAGRQAAAASLLACILFAMPAKAQLSVFADPTASRPGDLLTVVLIERTTAQRESNWANQSSGALSAAAEVDAGDLSGRFAADAQLNKLARNQNTSSQRDLLSGTITTRVLEVDPAGNLIIEGERRLSVNGESHLLRVSGIVRPIDVRANNTVLSPDIADANIEYRRGGLHRKFFKPALLTRIGVVAVLLAAILVGSN